MADHVQTDRIQWALDDLRRIQAGYVPTDAELSRAPTLEAWASAVGDGYLSVAGVVTGHPKILDGHPCVTSPVVAVADDDRWVRTLSRLYKLGRPLASLVGGLDG